MKPLLVLTAFALIFAQFALAGAEDMSGASSGAAIMGDNEPSINPDSFFWGFKDALDKFSLALTFDSESKAKKSITIAEERLREFEKMAAEGKLEAAKKAKESHDEFIGKAKSAAKSISEGNKTREMERQVEIESEVEKLENRTEIITERLKIKIETEGNLTAEQKALIDSLIASMQNQTGSLKIEIKQNKEKIKIEIKQRTNKTEEEIEDEIEEIEREHNITDSEERKLSDATEKILEAKKEIVKLMDEVGINNVTDNAVLVLMNNSLDKLDAARNALNASKYGEAYGLANAAKELAENAREKIDKLAENNGGREKERNQTRNETEDDGRVCIQIITPAKNEKTGECKEFPTPCDVPKGWKKVKNCINSGSNTNNATNTTNGSNETE